MGVSWARPTTARNTPIIKIISVYPHRAFSLDILANISHAATASAPNFFYPVLSFFSCCKCVFYLPPRKSTPSSFSYAILSLPFFPSLFYKSFSRKDREDPRRDVKTRRKGTIFMLTPNSLDYAYIFHRDSFTLVEFDRSLGALNPSSRSRYRLWESWLIRSCYVVDL